MSSELLLDSTEYVRSDKDTHFTGALAQNAVKTENISFPADWVTMGLRKAKIVDIKIISDQQLAWDVKFYSKDTHAVTTDLDADSFIRTFKFDASAGVQEAGADQYYYDIDPSEFPFVYIDEDGTSEFHVTLVNRSATPKTAGAAGEVVVIIQAIPIC